MRGTRRLLVTGAVMAAAILALGPCCLGEEEELLRPDDHRPEHPALRPVRDARARTPPPRRQLYNALTPLFDHVTPNDLFTDFKSEKLSVDTDGPTTQEAVPFPGVTLLRDRFNVPHIYAEHPRGRRRDGRLDPGRGPRAAAGAGPLQLAGRRHRRPGAERHRPDRRPADLQAERRRRRRSSPRRPRR